MNIIRYVDIFGIGTNENGEHIEKVVRKDVTLPVVIDPERVSTIQPFFSKEGRIFKNVSVIYYDGDMYKVVGNYKELDKKRQGESNRIQIAGFKKYTKGFEEKLQFESTIKRGTKGSN